MIEMKQSQQQMCLALNAMFKFRVGEHVALYSDLKGLQTELEINGPTESYTRVRSPITLVIAERSAVECHGGVQLFYHVRDNSPNLARMSEHELVPYDDVVAVLQQLKPEKKDELRSTSYQHKLAELAQRITDLEKK